MTITTPERLGDRLTGPDAVGVDELDVNGRSLNRPVPDQGPPRSECSKSGCATGRYTHDLGHTLASSRSVFKIASSSSVSQAETVS